MQKGNKMKPIETPDFATFITDLAHGEINQKLTEAMAEVIRAVEATNKVGELVVRFIAKRNGNMAIVATEIRKKIPEEPLTGSMFYIGDNGELFREDPRQLRLKNLDAPVMKTVDFPMGDM